MTPATQAGLDRRQWAIVLLVLATALIHLSLGVSDGLWMFIGSGVAYLALATAAYLPIAALARFRKLAKWGLLGFTAIPIIGWILIGERSAIGFIDKAIEVTLIILVFLDVRKQQ